jgi:transcriptional regulator with GAF, ATPase, and Fis domain
LSFGLDNASGSVNPLPTSATLEDLERAHIQSMLTQTGWRIEGERGAAALLGLNPSTLRGRIRKLGIRRNS